MPFPTTIPWDIGTSGNVDLGVATVRMEDGKPHNQTFYPSTEEHKPYRVVHDALTLAEVDTVIDYLRANADLEFDLIDPAMNRTYTGRFAGGDINVTPISAARWDVDWQFFGRRTV